MQDFYLMDTAHNPNPLRNATSAVCRFAAMKIEK
jgi:hypothetical protein